MSTRIAIFVAGSLLLVTAFAEDKKPSELVDWSQSNRESDHSEKTVVHVSVSGAVKKPGKFTLRASDSVWTAIEAAGGFRSIYTIKLCLNRKSKDGSPQTFFLSLEYRAKESVPLLLCEGDIIIVPEKTP